MEKLMKFFSYTILVGAPLSLKLIDSSKYDVAGLWLAAIVTGLAIVELIYWLTRPKIEVVNEIIND
jgi:hypothetical protein